MLSEFVYQKLGSRLITQITPPELLAALRAIESRGTHETAHRTKQRVGQMLSLCDFDLGAELSPSHWPSVSY